MEKKMVKQFSLTKLALALAIIGQFSGVSAGFQEDKIKCDRSEICSTRLAMLIYYEELYLERLYEEFPVEEMQEEFEKNLQNHREESIKLLRERRLAPLQKKSGHEDIERAERLYKERPAPSVSEEYAKYKTDQGKRDIHNIEIWQRYDSELKRTKQIHNPN